MSDFKEENEKSIKFNRGPTVVDLSFGTLKFKSLSMKDSLYVLKLLKEDLSAKDFTIKLFYNQMLEPKIEFAIFKGISDDELLVLMSQFIKDEYSLSKFYKKIYDGGDLNFVKFKRLIDKYLESLFSSFISSTSIISSFNRSFPLFNKPIFQVTPLKSFSSMIKESNVNFNRLIFGQSYYQPFTYTSNRFQNLSSLIKNTIQPQIDIWRSWAASNPNLFEIFFEQRRNLLSNYSLKLPVISKSLKDYQWFITPSLPEQLIYEALIICKKEGNMRKEINQLYYQHFSSNNFLELTKMVEGWKSFDVMVTRIRIIDSCLNLLKNNNDTIKPPYLVVPTLVTQIEGIEHELMKKSGLTPKGGRWFDNANNNVSRAEFYEYEEEEENFILSSAKSILLEVLYQKAYPGGSLDVPINFNRNKIAHGELLNYGTKYNVIRCFLLLDFLINLYAADD